MTLGRGEVKQAQEAVARLVAAAISPSPSVWRLLQGEGDQLRDSLLIQSRYDEVLPAARHVRDRETGGWSTRKRNLMDHLTRPLVVHTENGSPLLSSLALTCLRHLLRRLLGPTEVRGELRLPAPWRLRKRAGDRAPVADHASQRERRFDGARDLVQHELEVTPRAAGAQAPARRSPRGKSRGRGGSASPPAAPRTVSRRATPWRCRRRTSAVAPTAPET